MALQSRLTVFAAIGGLLALMGAFVLYASFDNPELERVVVDLQSVEVVEVNTIDNRAKLQVTFLVTNPSEKTFTVSSIVYDLLVDGQTIGSSQYSTEDIAMPGRPTFYPGAEVPLKNFLFVGASDLNSELYDDIISGNIQGYSTNGVITVETSWSLIEKEFQAEL